MKIRFIFFVLVIFIYSTSTFLNAVDSLVVHNETFYTGLTPLDSLNSITRLSNQIESLISLNSKNLSKTNYGIGVYSLNNKKWYFKKNIDSKLTPASTTKLFTTFALLKKNGKSFEIATEVYHDGKIDSHGILNGNIYIKGKGDALFSTGDLEILADKVKNFGIKKITGNVYADGTFFDEQTERIVYSGDKDIVQATPKITALNIDRNTATIIVTAGNKPGEAPNVYVMPSSESHIIINNAKIGTVSKKKKKTNKKKSRGEIINSSEINSVLPYNELYAGDFSNMMLLSAGAGISVSTKLEADGKQKFIINGTIRPNSTYSYQHLIANPPYTIAGAFKNRLKAGGITIEGKPDVIEKHNDSLDSKLTFLTDFRRPVFDVINIVNKDSDNYLAEILFKMIGANSGFLTNNAYGTRQITDSILHKCGIDSSECVLNDGSGLSRRNLITIESLINILKVSYKSDFYNELKNSLSIASLDGTLKKRFKQTFAESNLHAKTGTLRNVSALAGYVTTRDGEEFAFVFNGSNVGAYKMLENEIGILLSQFQFQEVQINDRDVLK
jgi:D-alanyl-D-alanine carboxypeptidase